MANCYVIYDNDNEYYQVKVCGYESIWEYHTRTDYVYEMPDKETVVKFLRANGIKKFFYQEYEYAYGDDYLITYDMRFITEENYEEFIKSNKHRQSNG